MKTTILLLLALAIGAGAQSTCRINTAGQMVLKPKTVAYEVVVQTATSLAGPWFTSVHVWGDRPCTELEFTLPKTNEKVRYWRLVIIR